MANEATASGTGIAHQVHAKFKVFVGQPTSDGIGPVGDQIAEFVQQSQVAAKSIGVEFLEQSKSLLVTLGYRSDEPSYPVAVKAVPLGKFDALDAGNFTQLEAAMEKAGAQLSNIICHAEFVTAESEFVMIFLTHQS